MAHRRKPRQLQNWMQLLGRPLWVPSTGIRRWTPKKFDMQGASPHPPDRPKTGQYLLTIRRDGLYHKNHCLYSFRVVHFRRPRRVVPVTT